MKRLLKKIIPDFLLSRYHWKLALLGALVYGWPSRKLKVIGVTGTKGKSTVVYLAGKILEASFNPPAPPFERGVGRLNPPQPSFKKEGKMQNLPQPLLKEGSKVGWISSLTINDGEKEIMNPYHMTMPGRFFIQKMLARMVKNGCEYALIEVTSEGIKQHRHRFIKWAGAVFTNLAPEHLETHGGFTNYRSAKLKLFEAVAKNPKSFGVYNLDDENAGYFLKFPVKKKIGYFLNPPRPSFKKEGDSSLYKRPASPERERGEEVGPLRLSASEARRDFKKIQISNVQLTSNGSEFEIDGVNFKTNLLGEFNVYNCAAAIAIGQACGVSLETAGRALEKIKSIPGRLEIIDEGQNFTVVVDLAHTPDSFEKVFALFKSLPHQKIISVFGSAGGGRDKWKRPELGRIASANSDQVIICNEDSYDEDPSQILSEIKSGISKSEFPRPRPSSAEGGPISNLYEIEDRRAAITKALSLAQKGDIVLLLGKGTEQTMVVGGKKFHWDDREVVRKEIRNLKIKMQNEK